ncbi:hypothetical protein MNEG_15386, partial [Monoraphidium neglectum]
MEYGALGHAAPYSRCLGGQPGVQQRRRAARGARLQSLASPQRGPFASGRLRPAGRAAAASPALATP